MMASSFNEIDPRLRDTASSAFSQQPPPNPNHPNQTFQAQAPLALAPSVSRSPVGPPPQQFASPVTNPYLPQTPQSGGITSHDGGAGQQGGGEDSKRPRACEQCRGLKVRCEPDPKNPNGPCKRCGKANRNCVVTVPTRKRQKKTDSRVAELEKKIDALSKSLAHKNGEAAAVTEGGLEHPAPIVGPRRNTYQQVTTGGFDALYAKPGAQAEEWAGYPKASEFDTGKNSAPPMVRCIRHSFSQLSL